MNRKNQKLKKQLEQSLPYPQLSPRANQAFEDAYAALTPLQRESAAPAAPSKHFSREAAPEVSARPAPRSKAFRRVAVSLASLALVCTSLFGLNLAFPAFAESIPGLGGMFKSLNSKYAMGTNLETYEDTVQPVNVTKTSEECAITVAEAYCEGRYVYVALNLTTEDPDLAALDWLKSDYDGGLDNRDFTATVNGEEAKIFQQLNFQKKGDHFESPAVITLPQEVENGTELAVTLKINALKGRLANHEWKVGDPPDGQISQPISLEFPVTADTSKNRKESTDVALAGVTFQGFESSPTYFNVTMSYPCWSKLEYQGVANLPWPEARTDTGITLEHNSKISQQLAPEGTKVGDVVSAVTAFDGVPFGTKQVIVTVYNLYKGAGEYPDGGADLPVVFAEFTIDLASGRVTPTDSYVEQGYESMAIADYAALFNAGPQFQDHVFTSAARNVLSNTDLLSPDENGVPHFTDGTKERINFQVGFFADVDEDLPLEGRLFLDGELVVTAPLAKSSDPLMEEMNGRYTIGESYLTLMSTVKDNRDGPREYQYKSSIKRHYTMFFYLDGYDYQALCAEDAPAMSWQLVNTETGQILRDSATPWPTHGTETVLAE